MNKILEEMGGKLSDKKWQITVNGTNFITHIGKQIKISSLRVLLLLLFFKILFFIQNYSAD